MDLLAVVTGFTAGALPPPAAANEGGGLAINFFWIIVASLNFVIFLVALYLLFGRSLSRMLNARRSRIEQGLDDAEQARRDRDAGAAERAEALAEARRTAREILDRAQKAAEEAREADIAATREELERLRIRATAEIEAEKQRALADLRAEVADLALTAAGRVVGETMSSDRERRLVEQFLSEASAGGPTN